ncbi:phosphatidate cytidylyltransferase [bacterium]|nr:phosphatidate cytidylyltransferase [bacterium]MBU1984916.1 phosphatidate cytidylyltransferase [bacterium]
MRNLAKRVLIAAVGIPLLLAVARLGKWYVVALVLALQLAILPEWLRLWRSDGIRSLVPAMILAALAVDFLLIAPDSKLATIVAAAVLGILLIAGLFFSKRRPLAVLSGVALYVFYIALPLAFWIPLATVNRFVRLEPAGALVILFVATWMCDSAAYFVGRYAGRRPLFTQASPNKTVEGFVGGFVGSSLILPALAGLGWVSPLPLDYVMLPIIVGLGGQAGDLLESLMKRESSLKDTSAILPGHGGLLDRFDSLLISAPLFLAYLAATAA